MFRAFTPLACTLALVAAALQPPLAAAAPAFRHVVLIIQENRTPDNLFGSNPHFEPGVDIVPAAPNAAGETVKFTPVALATCYDIAHSHASYVDARAGWDTEPVSRAGNPACVIPANPQFKYVDNSHGVVQPYFDIAAQYGFANRMFQTNQGPSFPAHLFLFAGTSAFTANSAFFVAENMTLKLAPPLMTNDFSGCTAPHGQLTYLIAPNGVESAERYPCVDFPTLPDLLTAHTPPLSWAYYAPSPGNIWTAPNAVAHICQPKGAGSAKICGAPGYTQNVHDENPARVLTDIAGCRLPAVTWVTPDSQYSDHAGGTKNGGPSWVASIINAIGMQSCGDEHYWDDTAILVTWDDWGGWADHVTPFASPKPPAWGAGYTYGFRVPLLAVSAYTQAGTVSNNTYDFGSLLYFIEQNFQLGFIGEKAAVKTEYADYYAAPRGNLAEFFSLAAPRAFVPIKAPLAAKDFLAMPASGEPADDD